MLGIGEFLRVQVYECSIDHRLDTWCQYLYQCIPILTPKNCSLKVSITIRKTKIYLNNHTKAYQTWTTVTMWYLSFNKMLLLAKPCLSVSLVLLYWMKSFCRERGWISSVLFPSSWSPVLSKEYVTTTALAHPSLRLSFSFFLFNADALYRLYCYFQRRSPWWRCDPCYCRAGLQ